MADQDSAQNDQDKKEEVLAINLTQRSPGLKRLLVAAGWDFNPYDGEALDVDLSCFLLGRDDQTRVDGDFVFYNNMQGAELAVKHQGDSLTGALEGDDESILIDLDNLPFDIWRIVFTVSIYGGNDRDQSFGNLRHAILRIENADTQEELTRIAFNHAFPDATALRLAELRREGVEWSFAPLEQPVAGGLAEIASGYGILISSTT